MYAILNIFFFIFHSFITLFNLFGWIWRTTRFANLISLSLTMFSWFILGIWYGYGYCPCTDWHWQIRMELGKYDMPASYIKFLLDKLTGMEWNAGVVDVLALVSLVLAVVCSLWLNIRDFRRRSA